MRRIIHHFISFTLFRIMHIFPNKRGNLTLFILFYSFILDITPLFNKKKASLTNNQIQKATCVLQKTANSCQLTLQEQMCVFRA